MVRPPTSRVAAPLALLALAVVLPLLAVAAHAAGEGRQTPGAEHGKPLVEGALVISPGGMSVNLSLTSNLSGVPAGRASGGGGFVFNETCTAAWLTFNASAEAEVWLPEGSLSLYLEVKLAGDEEGFEGSARFYLNQSVGPVAFSYDLPFTIRGESVDGTVKAVANLTGGTYRGPLGASASLTGHLAYVVDADAGTYDSEVYIESRASSLGEALAALAPIASLLSQLAGEPVSPEPVGPNAAAVSYEESGSLEELMGGAAAPMNVTAVAQILEELGIARLLRNVTGLSLSLVFAFDAEASGGRGVASLSFNFSAAAYGDFSGGLPLRLAGEEVAVLRNVSASASVGDGLLKLTLSAGADLADPWYAQLVVREAVPAILEGGDPGSYLVLRGVGGVEFLYEGRRYATITFTPANASEAEEVYVVIGGTAVKGVGEPTIVFKQVSEGATVRAAALANSTTVRVEAVGGSTAEVRVLGRRPVVVYVPEPGAREALVLDLRSASRVGELVRLEIAHGVDAPSGFEPLSKPYRLELEFSGKLRVKLYLEEKPVGEIAVAHLKDGVWDLLEPAETGAEDGAYYVAAELSDASVVLVVRRAEAALGALQLVTAAVLLAGATAAWLLARR